MSSYHVRESRRGHKPTCVGANGEREKGKIAVCETESSPTSLKEEGSCIMPFMRQDKQAVELTRHRFSGKTQRRARDWVVEGQLTHV